MPRLLTLPTGLGLNPLFTLHCHMQGMTYARRATARNMKALPLWLAGLMVAAAPITASGAYGLESRWAIDLFDTCAPGSEGRQTRVEFIDGYLRGTFTFAKNMNLAPRYCLPDGVGAEQVADAAYDLMRRGPHFKSVDIGGFLNIVLLTYWDCPTS